MAGEGSELILLAFFYFLFLILIQKMELKLSIKRVLLDILSIKQQVFDAFKDRKDYRELLLFLMEKDYYEDEELPIPTLKEMESILGLKIQQLRKMLKNIYYEFYSYEKNYTMNFNTTVIEFHLDYFKRYATFKCEKLTYLPKIGENITIPFLQATVGTDYFYVNDIRHTFDGTKQTIDIFLKGGLYNAYWYYRKHKAYELGELGLGTDYTLYEYQIKQQLGLRI